MQFIIEVNGKKKNFKGIFDKFLIDNRIFVYCEKKILDY